MKKGSGLSLSHLLHGTAMRLVLVLFVTIALASVAGCATPSCPAVSSRPATQPAERTDLAARRERARQLLRDAEVAKRGSRTEVARKKLTEAVTLDPGNGRARHALGLACFAVGDLRSAAIHLDAASRLLPGYAEPCYNLGLVLESGGKWQMALDAYERSLRRCPDHLATLENLCRVRLRLGKRDDETRGMLATCLTQETRPEWADWLQRELLSFRSNAPRDVSSNAVQPAASTQESGGGTSVVRKVGEAGEP
jgi:tetratricopeptide (TPR) repeat protein